MARKSYPSPPPPRYVPPPAANPILKAPTVKMEQPSLGRTLMEGFAFGTGSSIARESVSRIFNSNSTTITTPDIELQKNDKQHNCEKMLSQMNECFQADNMCGDLLEKYLLQCSNQNSYLYSSSSNV
jgi:hypothetical protein